MEDYKKELEFENVRIAIIRNRETKVIELKMMRICIEYFEICRNAAMSQLNGDEGLAKEKVQTAVRDLKIADSTNEGKEPKFFDNSRINMLAFEKMGVKVYDQTRINYDMLSKVWTWIELNIRSIKEDISNYEGTREEALGEIKRLEAIKELIINYKVNMLKKKNVVIKMTPVYDGGVLGLN